MGLLRRIFQFKNIKFKFRNPKLLIILLGGIFFAFLGLIIFRNQISTFFQSNPGAAPVAYWKFDEGQGSTTRDSIGIQIVAPLKPSADVITVPNGGPVNIDDASDFGAMSESNRRIIRISTGTLYAFLYDGGSCEIWKSTDGTSWQQKDTATSPVCSDNIMSLAVGSDDTLHLLYYSTSKAVSYRTFNTSTDLFGSAEQVVSVGGAYSLNIPSLALDSNNIPHIAWKQVAPSTRAYYKNRIGGSWGSSITLGTSDYYALDIQINEDNIPEIVLIQLGSTMFAYEGNQNQATSFTATTIGSVTSNSANWSNSIAIDANGNTWIAYNAASGYITLVKHIDGDAWSTWQTPVTNSVGGYEPSITINGTDIYVYYQDSNNDIAYLKYNGSWTGPTVLQAGTYQDVITKWSYYNNNNGSTLIDYLYSNNTDIYWASTSLATEVAGTGPSWQSKDLCISGSCLLFDGTDDYVPLADSVSSIKTISFWIRPLSTTNTLVDLAGSADIQSTSGTLSSGMTSPTIYVNGMQSSTIVANKWQYVTVTTDSAVTGSSIILGNISSSYFHGYLDEIKVYDYARSASQIKADYAGRASTKGVSAQFGETDLSKKLTDGLVGYWKMDEVGVSGSNWTAVDSSGNNINGAGAGNASVGTTASGKFGNGGFFDGNGDYVSVADGGSADVLRMNSATDLTLSSWIKISDLAASTQHFIISKYSFSSGQSGYSVLVNNTGTIRFDINGNFNTKTTTAAPISAGNWYNIVGVFKNGNKMEVYVNGSLIESWDITPTTVTAYTSAAGIGTPSNNLGVDAFSFAGSIDEVRIYNRSLNPSEVQQLYNFAPGPIGYWKMDEKQGSMIYDSSGYGFGGTINGTLSQTEWIPGKFGSAINFNGTINYINTYSSSFANTFNGLNGSISTWAKVPTTAIWGDSSINYLFKFGVDGNNSVHCYKPATNDDIQCVYTAGGTTEIFDYATTSTEWFYITVTWDKGADSVKWYINGSLKENDTGVGAWSGSLASTTTLIGSNSTVVGSEWVGYIDDFKIYNYARTPAQIISDMNAGHPAPGSPVGSALLHFKLDEGVGSTVNNFGNAGSTLNGSFTGSSSPTWTNNGKFGKALSFDGTDDSFTVADNSAFTFDQYTVSAWINPSKLPSATMVHSLINQWGGGGAGLASWIVDLYNTGVIRISNHDGSSTCTVSGTKIIPINEWTHIVATYSGGTSGTNANIYINGKLDNSGTLTCTSQNSAYPMRVGRPQLSGGTTENYKGLMDEIKIYNLALTADQVKVEFNRGQAQVMGAGSTGVGGTSPSNSASRAYCVPGDSATCSGPVGEWLMNEGVGNTLFDTSNNNLNANITTPPLPNWVQGKFGKALSFSGTHIPNDENFGYGIPWVTDTAGSPLDVTTNLTLEAWIKPTSNAAYGDIISKVPNGYGSGYELANSSGTLRTILRNGGSTCDYSAGTLTTNVWQYVVSSYNGATTKHYINGILQGESTSCATGADVNDDQLQIGNRKNDGHFVGVIDEVRVYNYARSAGQVAWSHNVGKPIGYWKLEECTGTTIKDWGQNANGSFSGNTGTLTIGATGSQTSAGTCSSGNTAHAWNNGTTGKVGASLSFDGSDDYITIGDTSLLDFIEGSSFSYSMWVKPTTVSTNGTIIAKKTGTGAGAAGYLTYINNQGKIATYISDGTDQVNKFTDKIISAGVWNNITVVYIDDTSLTMYINGADGAGSLSGTIANVDDVANASPLVIGAESDFQVPRDGLIDEIKIYNYALTPSQMKTEMIGGAVRFQ